MKALMQSNLFFLFFIMLPAFAYMYYNEQTQRIEPVEVYGMLDNLPKPRQVAISKRLPDQAECLAINAYAEARGEGKEGMIAVTNVVQTRVADPRWPKDYCKVVYQPNQFSWANSKQAIEITEPEQYQLALRIANLALNNKLPNLVGTADHYYAPAKANPTWAKQMKPVTKVRGHLFLDSKEKPVQAKQQTKTKQQPKGTKA